MCWSDKCFYFLNEQLFNAIGWDNLSICAMRRARANVIKAWSNDRANKIRAKRNVDGHPKIIQIFFSSLFLTLLRLLVIGERWFKTLKNSSENEVSNSFVSCLIRSYINSCSLFHCRKRLILDENLIKKAPDRFISVWQTHKFHKLNMSTSGLQIKLKAFSVDSGQKPLEMVIC